MRKSISKIITLSLALCLCVGCISVCAQDSLDDGANPELNEVSPTPGPELPPEYVEIAATSVGLRNLGGGSMRSTGSTTVYKGYNAGVTVELQRYYSDGWRTLYTWSDYDSDSAMAGGTETVSSGHYYRTKATHRSYTSGGSLIETVYTYSTVIWY